MKAFIRFITFIFLIFIKSSCTSELDFEQAEDIKLEPVLVTNLSYFDLDASKFPSSITAGSYELNEKQDFSPFRSAFLRKNLNEIVFDFEVENTIPREFSIDLVFLDEDSNEIRTIKIFVPPFNGGTPVLVKQKEIFEGQDLVDLQEMAQVDFRIEMKTGHPFSLGYLKLRSSATVYFEIE